MSDDLEVPISPKEGPTSPREETKNGEEEPHFFMDIEAIATVPEDLDCPLSEGDLAMIQEFEVAWAKFLKEKHTAIAGGKRGQRVAQLRKEVNDAFHAKSAAEAELRGQLELIDSLREELEEPYYASMEEQEEIQKEIKDRLEVQLDDVAIADHLGSCIIPWAHFLSAIDKAVLSKPKDEKPTEHKAKPSARAMALVNPMGEDQDAELRAYRIDHALLSTEARMLEKEIQCYDKTAHTLEAVGHIFTDNNIWSLLSKSSGAP